MFADYGGKRILFRAYYDFGTTNQLEAKDVTFDIMQDKSMATDPVIWKNLKSGSDESNKVYEKLYIANPKGADKNFTVVIIEV